MVRVPPEKLQTPAPEDAVLPEMVELAMLRMPLPRFRKAPPVNEEAFAPETVTPEMERLPPLTISKIRKSRPLTPLFPLMLSVEAPGPVMVRVPTVVPVPPMPEAVALAFKIVGNAAVKIMVPVMLKSMVSLPGVALASVIACRRDPVPEFAKEVTGKLVGTILPSSWRSWGGAGSSCFSILGVAKEFTERI